jgi:hypothetical protein
MSNLTRRCVDGTRDDGTRCIAKAEMLGARHPIVRVLHPPSAPPLPRPHAAPPRSLYMRRRPALRCRRAQRWPPHTTHLPSAPSSPVPPCPALCAPLPNSVLLEISVPPASTPWPPRADEPPFAEVARRWLRWKSMLQAYVSEVCCKCFISMLQK